MLYKAISTLVSFSLLSGRVWNTIATESTTGQRRLVTLLNFYRTLIPDDVSTYSFART